MKQFFIVLTALLLTVLLDAARIPVAADGTFYRIPGFFGQSGRNCAAGVSAALACDGKILTVMMRTELNGQKPETVACTHDSTAIFSGEVMEFAIAPRADGVYYQVGVNPDGRCYSARKRDRSWELPEPPQLVRTPEYWQFTVRIPLSAINAEPAGVWRANFSASIRRNGGADLVNWCEVMDYHDVTQFGELSFQPAAPGWKIRQCDFADGFFSGEITDVAAGITAFKVCSGEAELLLPVKNGSVKWRTSFANREESDKSPAAILVTAQTGEGEREVYRRRLFAVSGSPFEPDRFYYPPERRTAVLTHGFQLPAVVELLDGQRRKLREKTLTGRRGEFSLAGLADGTYYFRITGADGKFRTRTIVLTAVEAQPGNFPAGSALSIAGDKILYGGKPVFLVAPSALPAPFDRQPQSFNYDYGGHRDTGNWPQLLTIPGMVFRRSPVSGYFLHENWRTDALKFADTACRSDRIIRLAYEAQHQLLCGVPGQKDPVLTEPGPYYLELYREIKRRHPGQICSLHLDWPERLPLFVDAADVFEAASYNSSYHTIMLPQLAKDIEFFRRSVPGKPVICWLGLSIPDPQCRTAEEIRAGAYIALMHDCAGITLHNGHGGISPERTRLWSAVAGVNMELAPLFDLWHRGKPAPELLSEIPENVAAAVKIVDGGAVVILVNISDREKKFKFKFAGREENCILAGCEPLVLRFPLPAAK